MFKKFKLMLKKEGGLEKKGKCNEERREGKREGRKKQKRKVRSPQIKYRILIFSSSVLPC